MQIPTRLLLQIPATMAILALVPSNFVKLAALATLWSLTFGRLSRVEMVFYASVCVFFTAMNAASLHQGIFAFSAPDVLLMPVYELFMWGFYLLHTRRALGGPAPQGMRAAAWTLALLYAVAFSTIHDGNLLLMVTGGLLIAALILFHERYDLAYTGYMVALGAAIEYTGVLSGQWHYPGNPTGGVPLWFITLWGGVGLFLRRLVLPMLVRAELAAASATGAVAKTATDAR